MKGGFEMDADKRKRLAAVGWVETGLENLLGLTPEEVQLIDLRRSMARAAKAARERAGLTQADIAKKIKSSQPRVAKAEQTAKDVTLDLIFRCLAAAGGELKPKYTTGRIRAIRKPALQPKMKRSASAK